MTISNWLQLKGAVSEMRADGCDGFEGLLAQLFEAEMRQRFFVARTGDQPASDVYSPTARVALQAKRLVRSVVRDSDVEGDIDRALREIPALDVYVLATTKANNQLRLRLESKTAETGLDIVLLALTDSLSEFGALCVTHWEIVQAFLPNLDDTSRIWASQEAGKAGTVAALERLRSELEGICTQNAVANRALEALRRRINGDTIRSHAHNRVVISDLIERKGIGWLVTEWWRTAKQGVGVLVGDEGTGKTWVAAASAHDLAREQGIAVFWLDSLAWARAEKIENIVRLALETVFAPGDHQLLARILRKVFHRWRTPILIVLDGANERGAWEAAERLLHEYHLHVAHLLPRVRLLFTSRRLDHRPYAGPQFWSGAKTIAVGPFRSDEFQVALEKLSSGVTPDELPAPVRALAMIPRYFRLCIQLRERLSSLSHVTKEFLLWADLEAKLAARDPQWIEVQTDLGGSPQKMLSYLARNTGWPTGASGTSVPRAELLRQLPGIDRALHDLIEQRIVLSADFDATVLNSDHLILGWALALRETAKSHPQDDCDTLCDRLHRLLEPAASNDDKARAVHVAALLTFLTEPNNAVERVALLRLWALHHNAVVSADSLGFFARTNLAAYAAMVEAFFREHLSGHFESTLVAPLAILWRDQAADMTTLRQILERWLQLIFPGDASGSKKGDESPPRHFPIASTAQQLRLSYAAVSVISFRPDNAVLPALGQFYRSHDFCYHDTGTSEHHFRVSYKSPAESLGALARWHYREEVIPLLARIAANLPRDSKELHSLQWFARLWRLAWLPEVLGSANDIYDRLARHELSPREEFRNWLLDDPAAKPHFVGLGLMERLAVRRDLPELSAAEAEALAAKLHKRLIATASHRTYHNTIEERTIDDLLPWLARCSPDAFPATILELWKAAIASEETLQRLLHLDEMLPPNDYGGELVSSILNHRTRLVEKRPESYWVVPLTEAMLLHASSSDLHVWLKSLETLPLMRGGGPEIGILPLPDAFEALAPAGFDGIARAEADAATEAIKAGINDSAARNRATHWIQIYAYLAEPTEEVAMWALTHANTLPEDDSLRFPLFRIASRCARERVLRQAVFHPAFRSYQFGPAARHWWQPYETENSPRFTFAELANRVSLTVAGQLLLRSGQNEELRHWGRAISAAAMEEFGTSQAAPPRVINIETNVAPDGELEGFSTADLPAGGENWHAITSGVWGVDRESKRLAPTHEDYDRLSQELQDVMEARRVTNRREIAEFNAVGALWRWSELEPTEFTEFALAYLPCVARGDSVVCMDFGYFSQAVLIALLRLDPPTALKFAGWTSGKWKIEVKTLCRTIDWATAALWEKGLNHSAEVRTVRRARLLAAANDEELLWESLAAQAGDNVAEIAIIATEFLDSPTAPERALGVTLFAFQGDDASLAALVGLRENDASFWVREHAEWAWHVCATDKACRSRYREVVAVESLEMVAAGLAEMRMALSPLVHAWRRRIEQDASLFRQDRRRSAYLDLFWYHWGNTSSRQKDIKLEGRDLRKFCRGERLSDGVTGRMHPWWHVD